MATFLTRIKTRLKPMRGWRWMAANLVICYLFVVLLGQRHVWEISDFVFDLRAQLFHTLPANAKQVSIVAIDANDYASQFHGSNPLDEQPLRALIEKILEGHPAVVGVDIQTSDPRFLAFENIDGLDKIVWAKPAVSSGEDAIQPGTALGNSKKALNSGIAVFPDDSEDSATRRYQRVVETTKGDADSLAWAIAKRSSTPSLAQIHANEGDTIVRDIDYTDLPERPQYTATQITAPGFNWNHAIEGQTVLLGGRYDAADKHKTPYAGEMDGVDILANAIETEINHRSQPSPTHAELLILAIAQVLLLNVLFSCNPYKLATTISLILVLDVIPLLYIAGLPRLWPYYALITLFIIVEEGVVHLNHHVHERFLKSSGHPGSHHDAERSGGTQGSSDPD